MEKKRLSSAFRRAVSLLWRPTRLTPVRSVAIELIFADLAAQRVAVNSEHFCRPALISLRTLQSALDKALFKFPDCFLEQNPSFYHLTDEPFQLIFHDSTLRLRIKFVEGPAC